MVLIFMPWNNYFPNRRGTDQLASATRESSASAMGVEGPQTFAIQFPLGFPLLWLVGYRVSHAARAVDFHVRWDTTLAQIGYDTMADHKVNEVLWVIECAYALWDRGNLSLRNSLFWGRKLKDQFFPGWSGGQAADIQLERWKH